MVRAKLYSHRKSNTSYNIICVVTKGSLGFVTDLDSFKVRFIEPQIALKSIRNL